MESTSDIPPIDKASNGAPPADKPKRGRPKGSGTKAAASKPAAEKPPAPDILNAPPTDVEKAALSVVIPGIAAAFEAQWPGRGGKAFEARGAASVAQGLLVLGRYYNALSDPRVVAASCIVGGVLAAAMPLVAEDLTKPDPATAEKKAEADGAK